MKSRNLNPGNYLPNGFSMIELIIAVAIIASLSTIVFNFSRQPLDRSQVDAVALELAGWLQKINTTGQAAAFCTVTFNPNRPANADAAAATFTGVDRIFTVTPAECSAAQNFILPDSVRGKTFTIWSSPSLQFTQRGNVIQLNNNDIRILMNDTRLLRCVRTSDTIGLFRIGSNSDAATVDAGCTDNSFDRF